MQRKQENKKARKRYLFFLLPIAAVVFFAFYLWKLEKQKIWHYEGRFNVLDASQLILTSYYGSSGDEISILLPPDYFVEVAGGYGIYKFKNVIELARTEGNEEILKETVADLFGIPIDAFSSELTFWEKFGIWRKRQALKKSPKKFDLAKIPVASEEKLADQTIIKKIDPRKVDFYLSEVFWEKEIREENLRIAVFNASEKEGLANKTARLLENIGGKAVEVENYERKDNFCRIKTALPSSQKRTLARLRTVFKKCLIEVEEIGPRFDLIVIIV